MGAGNKKMLTKPRKIKGIGTVNSPITSTPFQQKERYMNKGELIEAVQKELGKDTSNAAAAAAVNAVIDAITKNVKKGPVQIIGFGTFSVVKRGARKGINPATGEAIKIKASKSVKFKPGAKLKAAV